MNNRISGVLKWLHKSQYVVAMVTNKTQIVFFPLIVPWLKYSYFLSVADVPLKVDLHEGKDH